MRCSEYWKQIFPEMKLRSLVSNVYIQVFVSDFYIPTIGSQTQYTQIGGPIVGIYKWLTDNRNWERGRAVSFLEIFVFSYSVAEMVNGLRVKTNRRL